ncbi:MAG: uroporphyrinogen decarboxylase family protein [Bacteroidaceae bacterium]|nr:thioredoxin family protein [Bacteroidaceae bacterium]
MNGKEILKKAYSLEPIPRAPWVPFVGVHAAQLIHTDAETYLRSEDLMTQGLNEAIRLYQPDGIPVAFDLQLEAEVLGCDLVWSKDNPPSVSSHPLGEGGDKKLSDLSIPKATDGRIGKILNVTRTLRQQHPDLALYGLITGPFTLALHLCGTDIFMKMFTDESEVHDIMAFCTKVCKAMSQYYVEAGCDIIAVVDPMCSQIGPDQFEQFVTPSCKDTFSYIKQLGAYSSFFVCGQAQHNIEEMCKCLPNNISIDENIPLDYVRDTCLSHGVSYGGNLKLTVVLLMGDIDDTRRNIVECLDIAGKDYKGYILSPGCDLAYATPVANLVECGKLIKDTYQQDIVRALPEKIPHIKPLDLSTYVTKDVVKIDCVTLDSVACAACQYMVEAARRAAEPYGEKVIVKEHSIKRQEGVEFMVAAGVKSIPSIVIDGEVKFKSNIPPIQEIRATIDLALSKKK